MLAVGTHEGLYRIADLDAADPERRLDCGTVHAVETVGDVGVFAATDEGLYHSRQGRRWRDLDVPRAPVVSVAVSPGRKHCYAGTYPACLYRATLRNRSSPGDEWVECDAFRRLPSRERWADRSPRDDGSQVRTLAVHPDAPARVVAGVEVGGVCVSDDRGETWTERGKGVHDDVHHVLALGPDDYVAACGNGLYRSGDGGRTWVRRDTDFRDFWYNYYRETERYDGSLYASAAGWGPVEGSGVILAVDDEGTPDRVPFPGSDSSFVTSWETDGHRLLAGTMGVADTFRQHSPSDVLAYDGEEWSVVATVPAGVKSVAVRRV